MSFIAACVALAAFIHLVAMILERATFFLALLWERGHAWSAYDTVVKTFQVNARSYLLAPVVQLCTVLLTVFAIALILRLAFRRRLVRLRTRDVLTAFAPAMPFGALAWGLAQILSASVKHQAGSVVGLGLLAQTAILLTLSWFCAHRLLSLGRWRAAGVTLACGLMEFPCEWVVAYALL